MSIWVFMFVFLSVCRFACVSFASLEVVGLPLVCTLLVSIVKDDGPWKSWWKLPCWEAAIFEARHKDYLFEEFSSKTKGDWWKRSGRNMFTNLNFYGVDNAHYASCWNVVYVYVL